MLQAENQEKNALELVRRAERKKGIQGAVTILKELNHSDAEIEKAICKQFELTPEEAKKYL
jgi:hypothetical protein